MKKDKELKEQLAHGGNIESAKVVGEAIAKKALKAGVKECVFDRGGFFSAAEDARKDP